MKRTSIIILLVFAAGLFSACAHMTGPKAGASASPVIDQIVKRGELIVGTSGNMPPLNMTTKEGEIIGMEPDLARYMADAMGVTLRFERMPFSELLLALETGKVDMVMSGMTIIPERNLRVAFVGPYFISGKAFLTKAKTIASVRDASDINSPDFTLVALQGSTSQLFAQESIPRAYLVATKDYDEAVDMVIQGKVDALIADYPICLVSLLRHPYEDLVSVITPLTYEPIGVAVPANDPLLVNWLENILTMLKGSGELEDLEDHWFEDPSWLNKLR